MLQSSRKTGVIIIGIMFALWMPRVYGQNEEKRAKDPKDIEPEFIQKKIGSYRKDLEFVAADTDLQRKALKIGKVMKQARSLSKDKGPQTIEEASEFLRHNLAMVYLPTKCFEYGDVFYFSGETTAGPIEDFSSGFAIRKDESQIYTWSASDLVKADEDKNK